MFASQPHGQLSFGPGTTLPQPSHVRGELQVVGYGDRCGGAGHVKTTRGPEGSERGKGEMKETGGAEKWRESDQGKHKQGNTGD